MVDNINKISGVQSVLQTGAKPQNETKKAGDNTPASSFNTADEVSISSEASALSQAEQQTSAIRTALEDNDDVTLGQADTLQALLT